MTVAMIVRMVRFGILDPTDMRIFFESLLIYSMLEHYQSVDFICILNLRG